MYEAFIKYLQKVLIANMLITVNYNQPSQIDGKKNICYYYEISEDRSVEILDDLKSVSSPVIYDIYWQNTDNTSQLYFTYGGDTLEIAGDLIDVTKQNHIVFIRSPKSTMNGFTSLVQVSNTVLEKRSNVKLNTETIPLYISGSAEIGLVGDSIFSFKVNQAVNIENITGITFLSDGGALTANAISSGSGTDSINISLNRKVLDTETITFSISPTNTITSVAGGLSFAGITDSAVVNNVVSFIYPLDYIAYYPFSGNANDEGGNYNGTIPIAPDLVTGYYNDANGAYFWDANERIDISSINAEIATHTQGSISAWIYITSNPSDVATIWALGSTSEGALMTGRISTAGNIQFYFLNGASATNVIYYTSTSTVTLNQWVNVVITQNGTDIDIYIDGVEGHTVTSLTGSSGTWANGLNTHETTFIGARQTNGVTVDKYMQGTIDDVIIYDRALTQQEITDINQ